jgi:hypothetical protein
MILVYIIKLAGRERLTAYPMLAEVYEGGILGKEKYPQQPEKLLRHPPDSIRLDKQDQRLLMSLMMQCGIGNFDAVFTASTGFYLVQSMTQTGRCYLWPNGTRPLVMGSPCEAKPVWQEAEQDAGMFMPRFEIPGQEAGLILPTAPLLWIAADNMTCSQLSTGMPADLAYRWYAKAPMPLDQAVTFVQQMAQTYPEASLAEPPNLERIELSDMTPQPVLLIDRQSDAQAMDTLQLLLRFRYRNREIGSRQHGQTVISVEQEHLFVMTRNFSAENAAHETLIASGLVPSIARRLDLFCTVDEQDLYALPAESAWNLGHLIGTILPSLEADGWLIRFAEGSQIVTPSDGDWYADFTTGARGWLAFESGIRVDGRNVNILPFIGKYIKARQDWSEEQLTAELTGTLIPVAASGCIVMMQGERLLGMIRQLFELYGNSPLDEQDRLPVENLRAAELAMHMPGTTWQPPPELVRLIKALDGALTVHPEHAHASLAATLRHYQEQGLGWLHFLQKHQLGGILADDMGLGKTMQVLALLLAAKHEGQLDLPALVVGPTSVLPNWRNEITRFAPELRCALLHGGERHAIWDDIANYDVLVTSYGVLLRDGPYYAKHMFSFVILDEAQAIKNPNAKISRIACTIKGRMRLCLTGTPMQNHLGELWSLMQFALPGLLGSETAFDRIFRKPIERDANNMVRNMLQQRVKPLILRRTKDMVALDLPPRNEIIQTLPLSDAQHDLYQTVRIAMTSRIQEEMAARGLARSRIVILDALLKLRQICCDPRLRNKKEPFNIPKDSAKLLWLAESIPEMIEEGRRILLFSQFTSMLDLIKRLLHSLELPFVEIRGSTHDRESPVRRFQAGEVPIFLISLKAGGTGLNLTAADTVIHYDPWWNPAVEAQATDRAHRIGQDKPVFVYKLIAEGTVEERIMELQKKKKDLYNIISKAGEASLDFSIAELDALLAPPGRLSCGFRNNG